MAKTYFLGVNRGEYQGRPFTSVYLGDEMTREGGKGLIAYRKSYRGESPAGLYSLNPGDTVVCFYDRYGNITDIAVDADPQSAA